MSEINDQITLDEIKQYLGNREWRLNNLYFIKDKDGKQILFKLNKIQKEIHDNLWFFNIIPKARQLGCTTFFAILYLDQILFSQNKTASIIAHTEKDMKKIFRDKIKFAWNNLHPWLKAQIGEPNTDSANELSFQNGGIISVSTSNRGGTVQFLHVSEFGYICQKYPEKAEEIVTGAINSVEIGNMVSIESTAAGKEGHFYDFCMKAEKMRQERKQLTALDFKIFFFAWWLEPKYTLEGNVVLTTEDKEYFTKLASKGVDLTEGQKRWYIKKRDINRDKMFREFPSTLDECFSTNIEGAYYKYQMDMVFKQNRIITLPYDSLLNLETWWDLGMNDYNVVLLVQTKGPQIRFINMYWNTGYQLGHYYDWLKKQAENYGYRYTKHVLPHDVEVRNLGEGSGIGITRKETLYKLGMRNVVVSPKTDKQNSIDRMRLLFPRFWFDEEKCKKLHEALFNYQKEWDKKMGVWRDNPKKSDSNHFADAASTGVNVWREDIPTLNDDGEAQTVISVFG